MAEGGARDISRPCVHLQQDLIISFRTSIATTRTENASLHFGGQVYQIPVFLESFCLGRSFPFFFRRILHHEQSLVHLHHPASTASAVTSVAAQANTEQAIQQFEDQEIDDEESGNESEESEESERETPGQFPSDKGKKDLGKQPEDKKPKSQSNKHQK